MSWSERQDRRQRAQEAAQDEIGDEFQNDPTGQIVTNAINSAIETATRVRADYDFAERVRDAVAPDAWAMDVESVIKEAFQAAGFEVEE